MGEVVEPLVGETSPGQQLPDAQHPKDTALMGSTTPSLGLPLAPGSVLASCFVWICIWPILFALLGPQESGVGPVFHSTHCFLDWFPPSNPPELLHIIFYVDDNVLGAARLFASAAACRGSSPLQTYGAKGWTILLNPILVKRGGKASNLVSIRKQTSFFCSTSETLSSLQLLHLFSGMNVNNCCTHWAELCCF